jgi:hypothetical protein
VELGEIVSTELSKTLKAFMAEKGIAKGELAERIATDGRVGWLPEVKDIIAGTVVPDTLAFVVAAQRELGLEESETLQLLWAIYQDVQAKEQERLSGERG